jgi:hypothetical protein
VGFTSFHWAAILKLEFGKSKLRRRTGGDFTFFCCAFDFNLKEHKHVASREMYKKGPTYARTRWDMCIEFLRNLLSSAQRVLSIIWEMPKEYWKPPLATL